MSRVEGRGPRGESLETRVGRRGSGGEGREARVGRRGARGEGRESRGEGLKSRTLIIFYICDKFFQTT